jgi:hypothetical protein
MTTLYQVKLSSTNRERQAGLEAQEAAVPCADAAARSRVALPDTVLRARVESKRA